MRIVKQVSVPSPAYAREWECWACGCVWELDATDPEPPLTEDANNFHTNCPQCGADNYNYAFPQKTAIARD